MNESRGVVAVSADEAGRYTQFAMSMQGLRIPVGSRTVWQIGNDISGNRNGAVESLLASDEEWVFFMDDDHAFNPNILMSLLARDVDIVTPLCLRRVQPFLPVACVDEDFMDLSKCPVEGIVEVQHSGSAGMLIRRHVLEALEAPWFELGHDAEGRRISEDVTFCMKAREAGFKIHVDVGEKLGHITTAVVWPAASDGGWLIGFTIADGCKLAIPLAETATRA